MSKPSPSASGLPKENDDKSTLTAEQKRKAKLRRPNQTKIRIRLPSIETYQREVVFRAEGPGRVVVRLERLMGSDRVRLTDQRFMSTLLERLEGEEHKAWEVRTASRKKAENNRSRQLAIDGLMEPSDDMQDLYGHPVFRVNRVLKRLAQFDQTMTAGQQIHLPPITPIDPFVNDDTGGIFKSYPGHAPVDLDELSELTESRAELYAELNGTVLSEMSVSQTPTKAELNEEFEGEDGDEWLGEGEPPKTKEFAPGTTLAEIQKEYGIEDQNLEADWEPFRSHLVDMLYGDEAGGMTDLYEIAEQVLGVYARESMTADDFVEKLDEILEK